MKPITLVGLLGLGAASVTAFMLWPADDLSPRGEAAKPGQKTSRQAVQQDRSRAASDTRVALLAREVDDLRAQVQKVEAGSQEQQAQEETSEASAEQAPPLSSKERRERKVAFYSGRLELEARDEQAAAEFEQKLEQGFATISHSSLGKVDCRSTMCRIEIIHTEPNARDKLHELVLGSGPLKYGSYDYVDQEAGGGGTRTIAYVGMPGHPLVSAREAIASNTF